MFRSLLRRDFAGLKFKFRFVLCIAHLPEIVDRCTLKGCRNRENLLEQREEEGERRCVIMKLDVSVYGRYGYIIIGIPGLHQGYKDTRI